MLNLLFPPSAFKLRTSREEELQRKVGISVDRQFLSAMKFLMVAELNKLVGIAPVNRLSLKSNVSSAAHLKSSIGPVNEFDRSNNSFRLTSWSRPVGSLPVREFWEASKRIKWRRPATYHGRTPVNALLPT